MLISLLIVFKEKSPHVIYCVKLLLIEKCLKINIKIIQLNLESLKCDYFAEFLNTPLMPIRHFIKRLKIWKTFHIRFVKKVIEVFLKNVTS